MNRLALVLAALLASSVVACAAESGDETVAAPPVATEEPTSELEAKPHSAPAASAEEVANADEAAAFAIQRVGDKRAIPTPTPKPKLDEVGELDVQFAY